MFTSPDAPPPIRRAVALLWVTVVLGALYSAYQLLNPTPDVAELAHAMWWTVVCVFLGYSAIVYLVSRGRNWARYVLLFFAIGGLVVYLAFPPEQPLRWWEALIEWGSTALELIALYWLFIGPATNWYTKKSPTVRTVA